MIIPHLAQLGLAGLNQNLEARVIEIRPQTSKKVPFSVLESATVEASALATLKKLDPSNFLPPNTSAKEKTLAAPKPEFFRGIPVDGRGVTQTTALVKLVHFVFCTRWYHDLIKRGILDEADARQRVAEAQAVTNPKTMASQKNPEPSCQLPVIGKTPQSKWVVLGLRQRTGAFTGVDEEVSAQCTAEVMKAFDGATGQASTVSHELQTSKGRARNLFGKVRDLPDLLPQQPDEAARIFGQDAMLDAEACLAQFNRLPRHRVPVGENPDTSQLLFIPYRPEHLDGVAAAVKEVAANNELHRANKGRKRQDEVDLPKPLFLPTPKRRLKSKVMLVYKEGGTKAFWLVTNVFPEVPLYYWQVLNEELRPVQGAYVAFFNACLANHKSKSPALCAYRAWTDLFTAALAREPFDRFAVWRSYPVYLRKFSNKELLEGDFPKARALRSIVPNLRKLHHLIQLMTDEANLDLDKGEIETKVAAACKDPGEEETRGLLGVLWQDLPDWQREQLVRIHRTVAGGIPPRDLAAYLKGAFCGTLLSNLVYQLSSEKFGIQRRFDLSAGMHLTNLRGQALIDRFLAAKDLINGLAPKDKARVYQPSRALMNRIAGMTELSKTDAFNTGFVSNC